MPISTGYEAKNATDESSKGTTNDTANDATNIISRRIPTKMFVTDTPRTLGPKRGGC